MINRQQATKRMYEHVLDNLDRPIDASDLAVAADTTPGTASKFLRDFDLPGYVKTRDGNVYVISSEGPRSTKPRVARKDRMAAFEKLMADEKTAEKIRELLRMAYLAGSQ